MKIAGRQLHRSSPPYIIAEIGVNHDGDVAQAVQLIEMVAKAQADAVKFQIFDAHLLLSREADLTQAQRSVGETSAASMLKRLELSLDQFAELANSAHEHGLHAIATVFSIDLVAPAAMQPWDAFKTASPDLVNLPLLTALAETGRPLLVSTGAASLKEVQEASAHLGSQPHLMMQCVSAYPTPEDEASLGGIEAIRAHPEQPVGYSDHTCSLDTGALAVAAGASVLEKHLTYSRTATGPDHATSLNPDEFATYVAQAHRSWRMLGQTSKHPHPTEVSVREQTRQSLTTRHALRQGAVVTQEDLTIKRPGSGLPPSALQETIGRTLAVDLDADVPIKAGDLV